MPTRIPKDNLVKQVVRMHAFPPLPPLNCTGHRTETRGLTPGRQLVLGTRHLIVPICRMGSAI